MHEQIVVLLTLTKGLFDNIQIDQMKKAELVVRNAVNSIPKEILDHINSGMRMSEKQCETILALVKINLNQME